MGSILSWISRSKGTQHNSPTVPSNTDNNNGEERTAQNPCIPLNYTGCEITIQGKLLLVLDTINSTLQTYFSCFCELVISRLNNTNVTSEVLFGTNTSTCSIPEIPHNVDQILFRNKLTNLSSEFRAKDKETGMAIILSDQRLTSENFPDLPDDREPFLYIVNVGQNESESRSCFRQHRFIREIENLKDFGLEMESIGCDAGSYKQANCPAQYITTPVFRSTATDSSKVVGLPLVVLSIVAGALVIAALVIVYLVFRPKCRKQGKYKRNTQIESSAFVGNALPQKSELQVSSKNNDVYNVLWEKEMRETDKNNDDNYHHIDVRFVKKNVNPILYDVVGDIRENHNTEY